MHIREALAEDIPQIQLVRNSVKENMLSNPALVSDQDCLDFISVRGKGWVCEMDQRIVGFAIVDLRDENIWALFLHPDFEKQGIGRCLHNKMLYWYFSTGKERVWLGTAPNSRAEEFYRIAGCKEVGLHGKEIKFEMNKQTWQALNP